MGGSWLPSLYDICDKAHEQRAPEKMPLETGDREALNPTVVTLVGTTATGRPTNSADVGLVTTLHEVLGRYCWSDYALHAACRANDEEGVVALLNGGFDPCARSGYGGTPLHAVAMFTDNPKLVHLLYEASGAPSVLNMVNEGWTPLICAADMNHFCVLQALVDLKSDETVADKMGKTALDWAVERNNLQCVDILNQFISEYGHKGKPEPSANVSDAMNVLEKAEICVKNLKVKLGIQTMELKSFMEEERKYMKGHTPLFPKVGDFREKSLPFNPPDATSTSSRRRSIVDTKPLHILTTMKRPVP